MFIDDIADVDDEDEEEEVEVGSGMLSSCCSRVLGVRAEGSVPSSPTKEGDRSTPPVRCAKLTCSSWPNLLIESTMGVDLVPGRRSSTNAALGGGVA